MAFGIKQLLFKKFFLVFTSLLVFSGIAFGQTITSNQTGGWNTTTTWVGGVVPVGGDNVIIAATHTVTVDVNSAALNNLTVNSTGILQFGSTSGAFTVDVDGNLTNNGTVNLDQGGTQAHTIQIAGNFDNSSGTFTSTGSGPDFIFVDFDGTGSMAISGAATFYRLLHTGSGALSTGSSVITIQDQLDLQGTAGNFTVGSGGLIIEAGTININGSAFDATTNTSTVTFQGSNAPTISVDGDNISPLTFYNLIVTGQDLTLSATGTTDVAFTINNNLTLTDQNLVIGSAGETLAYGTGATLIYNGSSLQTVDIEWTTTLEPDNVTVNNAADVSIASGDRSVDGDLTLTNGELAHSGTLTVNGNITGGSGSYGQTDDGTLLLNGGDNTNVTVSNALSLHNLTINKTFGASVTVTVASGGSFNTDANASMTITEGTLAFSTAAQLNLGATNNLTVSADGILRTGGTSIAGFAGTVTFSSGSIVDFSGSTAETIAAYTYSNLTVSNSNLLGATVGGSITVNNALTVNSGSRLNLGNETITKGGSATLVVNGTLYTDGSAITGFSAYTLTSVTGTVRFNGSSGQETAATTTYNNLIIDNSNGLLLTGDVTVNGTLTLTNGIIDPNANTFTLGAGAAVAGGSAASYVDGTVDRDFNSATEAGTVERILPVGSGAVYRPIRLDYTGLSGAITITASQTESAPTGTLPGGITAFATGLSRYWSLTSAGAGTFTNVNIDIPYTGTTDPEAALRIISGTNATSYTVVGSSTSYPGGERVQAQFTSFSDFAIGRSTGVVTWDDGFNPNSDWSSAQNWNPNGVPNNGDIIIIPAAGGPWTVTHDASVSTTNYSSITIEAGNTLVLTGGSLDISATPISVASGSQLTFNGTTISAFDETNTTYSGGSTVAFNTGQVRVDDYSNLTIAGASGGSGTANVAGNIIINSGSFGGTIVLNGSSTQTVSGTTVSFTNVTLDNSAGFTVSSATNVTGTLALTDGIAENSSNVITAATITGGSSSSYISGPLAITSATGSKTFPIGDGNYRPVTTNLTSGGTPTVQFQVFDSAPNNSFDGGIVRISIVRYFLGSITSGTITGGNVTLSYGADDGVSEFNESGDVIVVRSSDNSSDPYSNLGGDVSGSVPSGTVTSQSGVGTTLDYFTFGTTTGDNSLPVELLAFEALSDYDKVTLNWQTASEIENLGFNIFKKEISENNEEEWQQVNEHLINGRGNSSIQSDYTFVDTKVTAGNRYSYKLESISYNGLINVEGVIETQVLLPDRITLFNNYPNPFNPTTHIKFQLPEFATVNLTVYDLSGKLVKDLLKNAAYNAGQFVVSWDATDNFENKVSSGMYIYRFTSGSFTKIGRMLLIK